MTEESAGSRTEHNRTTAFAILCEQAWNQVHGAQEHWGTRDRITKELWTQMIKDTIAVVTRDATSWLVVSGQDEPPESRENCICATDGDRSTCGECQSTAQPQETELSVLREIRDFLKAPIPGSGRDYPLRKRKP